MSDKVKIGDREYTPPFTGAYAPQGAHVPIDSTGKVVQIQDDFAALNELAELRQEVERLKNRVEELEAKNERLKEVYNTQIVENEDGTDLILSMGESLTACANLFKGQPKPLSMHSTHDLKEIAERLNPMFERVNELDSIMSEETDNVVPDGETIFKVFMCVSLMLESYNNAIGKWLQRNKPTKDGGE